MGPGRPGRDLSPRCTVRGAGRPPVVETVTPASGPAPVRTSAVPLAGTDSPLTDLDLWLFGEGRHTRLYDKLGAQPSPDPLRPGTRFAVWAPNAREVSVIGDWNDWTPGRHPLAPRGVSGIREGFVPAARPGHLYKYHIVTGHPAGALQKADPCAAWAEDGPGRASRIWAPSYRWGDGEWMAHRARRAAHDRPVTIYEVHLGSWRGPGAPAHPPDGGRSPSYAEMAEPLADYVSDLGFTHVELMPVTEHPYPPSWGYQTTGYYAPAARYGTPEDLMRLVDVLHRRGIGVILDWVPSHFATDLHGPARFDGTHLYEHADPRQGVHPDWGSAIFNYARNEVRSFLLSSAMCWLDRYHFDGLRVDAVASMLYLDYSRPEGEWIPNPEGGRENRAAEHFLRELNTAVYREFPGTQTFAEESTAWPGVSRPVHHGGLGFGYKWDLGWMHDTLRYLARDPAHRAPHRAELTFRALYAASENYVLPLGHDEVAHGKGSLLAKMPGDEWRKFANLRLLYTYMFTLPGKKLLFMGGEFAVREEWQHDRPLDRGLLDDPAHAGVRRLVSDLAAAYRDLPACHRGDHHPQGFAWAGAADRDDSVLSYLRLDPEGGPPVLAVLNFAPEPRSGYRVGVPQAGEWREVINSDAVAYGGSGVGNLGRVAAHPGERDGHPASLSLLLPPLGGLVLTPVR